MRQAVPSLRPGARKMAFDKHQLNCQWFLLTNKSVSYLTPARHLWLSDAHRLDDFRSHIVSFVWQFHCQQFQQLYVQTAVIFDSDSDVLILTDINPSNIVSQIETSEVNGSTYPSVHHPCYVCSKQKIVYNLNCADCFLVLAVSFVDAICICLSKLSCVQCA